MTLQEEKIQDDRIRGTPEIGCRGTYSIAGLRPCWSGACRRADAAVQIRVVAALWGLGRACRGRPHLIPIGDGRVAAPIRVTM